MTSIQTRREWPQFSLKSLLLVFLVVASFFAGRLSIATKVQQMRQESERQRAMAEMHQQRAVDAIYRYQTQLAEKALADQATHSVREQLLLQAQEQHNDFLFHANGDGQADP